MMAFVEARRRQSMYRRPGGAERSSLSLQAAQLKVTDWRTSWSDFDWEVHGNVRGSHSARWAHPRLPPTEAGACPKVLGVLLSHLRMCALCALCF